MYKVLLTCAQLTVSPHPPAEAVPGLGDRVTDCGPTGHLHRGLEVLHYCWRGSIRSVLAQPQPAVLLPAQTGNHPSPAQTEGVVLAQRHARTGRPHQVRAKLRHEEGKTLAEWEAELGVIV